MNETYCSICVGQGRGRSARSVQTFIDGWGYCFMHAEDWFRLNGTPDNRFTTHKQEMDLAKG